MHGSRCRLLAVLTLVSLGLWAGAAHAGPVPTRYRVLDLGRNTAIYAIDDDGTLLAQRLDGRGPFLVRPLDPRPTERPITGLTDTGVVRALRGGVLVGQQANHATLWRPGKTPRDLGTLGSPALYSSASAVSRRLVVGICAAGLELGAPTVPCVWPLTGGEPGPAQALPTLGGRSGTAEVVTDDGFLCGASALPTGIWHATCWQHGQALDLTPLSPDTSTASGVTRHHLVVGWGVFPGFTDEEAHALAWTPRGGLVDLGTLPGHRESVLLAVSDTRTPLAVGYATFDTPGGPEDRAVRVPLDAAGRGRLEALESLLDRPAQLRYASAVNRRGLIAARGADDHGYLLVPLDGDDVADTDTDASN